MNNRWAAMVTSVLGANVTIAGCPKKVTNRMLLKPQRIRPITSSRHPLLPVNCFWSFLTETKHDQALLSHVHEKIWLHSTQFWLGFLGTDIPLVIFGTPFAYARM